MLLALVLVLAVLVVPRGLPFDSPGYAAPEVEAEYFVRDRLGLMLLRCTYAAASQQ
jgi:hypothetical protein